MDKQTAIAVFLALAFQRVQGAKNRLEKAVWFLVISQAVIICLVLFDILKGC